VQTNLNKEDCIAVLKMKAAELNNLPKKADFTEYEAAMIKAHLGPWPRALEAAGLKPPKEEDRKAKNHNKRINAKRKRIEALKKQN
jgi:hypothetical protein